ncbi:MAG: tRNA (adenosine(37)-N6)-threonylcarbamoyltransferase complex ATPase subunit type 1 TsaE [Candidatus Babeliaceae bacterium]
MAKTHELIYELDTLDAVAEELFFLLPDCAVMTFSGTLGAGKTTLIRALLKQVGIEEEYIQSPTFTYLVPYTNASGQTFYHFDLYRLKNTSDFTDAGFHEYLYELKSWCLIEWPDIVFPLLKDCVCFIDIDYYGENRRRLRYEIR